MICLNTIMGQHFFHVLIILLIISVVTTTALTQHRVKRAVKWLRPPLGHPRLPEDKEDGKSFSSSKILVLTKVSAYHACF